MDSIQMLLKMDLYIGESEEEYDEFSGEDDVYFGVLEFEADLITYIDRALDLYKGIRSKCNELVAPYKQGNGSTVYGEIQAAIDCDKLEGFKGIVATWEHLKGEGDIGEVNVRKAGQFPSVDIDTVGEPRFRATGNWVIKVTSEETLGIWLYSGYDTYKSEELDLGYLRGEIEAASR